MSTGKIKQLAFSEGVTVGTPSEIAALAVGLASYASEAAFVSAEGAATVGDAFYDTGASAIKYYDGAWKTVASTATALSNPMSDAGDMIYGGASGATTKLATGATAGLLHGGNGATPSWSKIVNADVDASAAIEGSKLVAATNAVAGAMTPNAQSFGGLKTFHDGIKLDDDASAGGRTALTYYAEGSTSSTFTFNGSGSPGTSGSVTLKYTRIGNVVTLRIPSVAATTGTGSTSFTANTAIDSWAHPPANIAVACARIRENGAADTVAGEVVVTSAGVVTINRRPGGTGAWSNATSCGIEADFNLSWVVG